MAKVAVGGEAEEPFPPYATYHSPQATEREHTMALTLAEAAEALSNDLVQRGVIETILEESPILMMLPFETIEGNSFKYNQENTLGGYLPTHRCRSDIVRIPMDHSASTSTIFSMCDSGC